MIAGPVRFCRYAYAPNALGYCGPDDNGALLEYGAREVVDGGLVQLARAFEGAWPYLSLIAQANGIADPLDGRVVAAYWVGNSLLDNVSPQLLRRFLETTFRPRMGSRHWSSMSNEPLQAGSAHHNHHVFVVYPWVGMLRLGRSIEPLRVLERCRIRWGEVVDVTSDRALVRSRPLVFDGTRLRLGPPRVEDALVAEGGIGFVADPKPGDRVSLHWDWVCERLSAGELGVLRRASASALMEANRILRGSPAGSVLD
jgi:hypothetical protein